jgi:hypothetical protein
MTRETENRVDTFFAALARGLTEDPDTRRELLIDAGLDPDEVVHRGLALVQALQRDTERIAAAAARLSIDAVPVKELIKRGFVQKRRSPADQVEEVLRFFAVSSIPQWQQTWSTTAVRFRRSPNVNAEDGAVAAWLRIGQIEAEHIQCDHFDRENFLQALGDTRLLTLEHPRVFLEKIKLRCAMAGVAVVFVPALPKTGVSGATHWISASKAIIQLSLRYRSDDHFWFTFYHEAAHVILHGRDEIFIEGKDVAAGGGDPKEMEANDFAAEFLIPGDKLSDFARRGTYSKAAITSFARSLGIAPGIVVGQLQKRKRIRWDYFNALKQKVWFDS